MPQKDASTALDELRSELTTYLHGGRNAYLDTIRQHLATSDLVLVGTQELEALRDDVLAHIELMRTTQ
jgi:hypothetical protein